MIIIDKADAVTDIFLPLDGLSDEAEYTFKMISPFDKGEFTVSLSQNYSDYPERYYLYKLEKDIYKDFQEGIYLYTVYPGASSEPVLTGILRVIDTGKDNSPISLPDNRNPLIVYNNDI